MKSFVLAVIVVALSPYQSAYPLHVSVVSSPAEIVAKNVVWLRCDLSLDELALLHKGLAVYADNQFIQIISWHVDATPALLPPQIFNRVRSAYMQKIFVGVMLHAQLTGYELEKVLEKTTFYIAGLVLKQPLTGRWLIQPTLAMGAIQLSPTQGGLSLTSPYQHQDFLSGAPTVLWRETKQLNGEFLWLDALSYVWGQIVRLGIWVNNAYLLLFFFYLMIGCILKRHVSTLYFLVPLRGLALQWLEVFAVAGFFILLLCQLLPFLGLPFGCAIIGLFFLFGEGYVFIFQPTEKLFLGRLTALFGWLMGICVLPCLVKGILSWYGW